MTKIFLRILLAVSILLPSALSAKNPRSGLTVMSYNIRVSTNNDGTNSWTYRYAASAMMLDDVYADIVGIQESLFDQYDYLQDILDKKYKAIGTGGANGKKEGEINTILYNYKVLSLQKWGTFWLSETPEKASKGWDAEDNRTATWAIFKDKDNGKRFIVVNTRLDEAGSESREKGMDVLMEKISSINTDSLPVVITGDFAVSADDSALAALNKDYKNAMKTAVMSDDHYTYNGWGRAKTTVDHIFYKGFGSCTVYETVTKAYDDRTFISDHFPIKATLMFQ